MYNEPQCKKEAFIEVLITHSMLHFLNTAKRSPSLLLAAPLSLLNTTKRLNSITAFSFNDRRVNDNFTVYPLPRIVLDVPPGTSQCITFEDDEGARLAPMARTLLSVQGIQRVTYGRNWIGIEKDPNVTFIQLRAGIEKIMTRYLLDKSPFLLEEERPYQEIPFVDKMTYY